MTPPAKPDSGSALLPLSAMAIAMVSVQFGAAFAKRLFPLVGAEGATTLRVALAAAILITVMRPWRAWPSRGAWPALLSFGVVLGVMNLLFYSALQRIPLGIAVGLEFTGPLVLASLSSRRWRDLLWIGLAAAGLVALLPLRHAAQNLDPLGVGLALGAGVCWALYIVLGKRAGAHGGGQAVTLSHLIAAMVVTPVGLAHAGAALFAPSILLSGVGLALLSSVIPYSLEMYALTRVPTRVFGTLMSLEPAIGAVMGLIVLGERLTLQQVLAIAAIILASAGVTATMRAEPAPN